MSDRKFIPYHFPEIGEEEIQEVVETLRSGWLTTGSRAAQFEKDFVAYTSSRHALAVSSCTAALHLAMAALHIGPGDEVITTPLTFCSTVHTILHLGAVPVLADIGPDGNLDPAEVARKINCRTRAILPVHYAGFPCQMEEIWKLARLHNLRVVEDAAHAVGTYYGTQHLGSAHSVYESDAVAFSFYATKNVTTGEGGMLTTNSTPLAARMKMLALHGISRDAWDRYTEKGNWYYEVLEPGYKYNLSDVQSALGIHQLRKLERFIEIRTRYARLYQDLLGDMDELEIPPDCDYGRHSWHLYPIRLNLDQLTIDRGEFIVEMKRRHIGASVHFIPLPLHPFFRSWAGPSNHCPRALELYPRLVSLPLYPSMSAEEVQYVAASVQEIIRSAKKTKSIALGAA